MPKSTKSKVKYGFYYCFLDDNLYIKDFDEYGECWWKSKLSGDFLSYSVSFDKRVNEGYLEFIGSL